MKKFLLDYSYLLGIAGSILALDYWTKWLVRTNLEIGEMWVPWHWLLPYARIVYWHNTGAAFGIFQNMNIVFSILAVLVSVLILIYFHQVPQSEWHLRLAMSMQMGGALGNLLDRLREGYVVDFISLGKFAVFNVADASISIGVAVLLVGVLTKDWQYRRTLKTVPQETMVAGEPELDAGESSTIASAEPSMEAPELVNADRQIEQVD